MKEIEKMFRKWIFALAKINRKRGKNDKKEKKNIGNSQ